MSFDPLKYLDDPPPINEPKLAQFMQHYRELVEFVKKDHLKQRQLGYGVSYDSQDRVQVPIWWLWMHS